MRKLILVFCFFSCLTFGWSQRQSKLKESFVDSASYVYFTQGKHDVLVSLIDNAFTSGIDSYYLRVRLGVSYFTKNEFNLAILHLRKALVFYPSDMYTKDFLFYAYLYTENFEEAKILITKMPITYQASYQKLIKRQNSVVFEYGYQTTSYSNKQDSSFFLAKDFSDTSLHGNGVYAESDRMKSLQYLQFGMGYPLSKRIKGYSGVSIVQNNRESHIYSKSTVWNFDTSKQAWLNNSIIKDTSHEYTLAQYQVYTGLTIALPKHITLLTGAQYMFYSQNKMYATYNSLSNNYQFKDSVSAKGNFVSNVSLTKSFLKLIPMLSVGFNKIDGMNMSQIALQTSYLPFGNFNLSLTGGVSISSDNKESRNVLYLKVGGKINSKLWYDSYLYTGNLKYFTEGNGYVVYNVSDKITLKSGVNLSYYFNQKWSIGVRYDVLKREASYLRYYTTSKYKSYTDNYLNHVLILNLLWKF